MLPKLQPLKLFSDVLGITCVLPFWISSLLSDVRGADIQADGAYYFAPIAIVVSILCDLAPLKARSRFRRQDYFSCFAIVTLACFAAAISFDFKLTHYMHIADKLNIAIAPKEWAAIYYASLVQLLCMSLPLVWFYERNTTSQASQSCGENAKPSDAQSGDALTGAAFKPLHKLFTAAPKIRSTAGSALGKPMAEGRSGHLLIAIAASATIFNIAVRAKDRCQVPADPVGSLRADGIRAPRLGRATIC